MNKTIKLILGIIPVLVMWGVVALYTIRDEFPDGIAIGALIITAIVYSWLDE